MMVLPDTYTHYPRDTSRSDAETDEDDTLHRIDSKHHTTRADHVSGFSSGLLYISILVLFSQSHHRRPSLCGAERHG